MTILKEAQRYVLRHSLDKPDRSRPKNYKRIIVANVLRREGYTLTEIGKLFKRNHATVINMEKNYAVLSNYSDFREVEKTVKEEMKFETLEERVMKVNNMADLWHLQEYVKELNNQNKK